MAGLPVSYRGCQGALCLLPGSVSTGVVLCSLRPLAMLSSAADCMVFLCHRTGVPGLSLIMLQRTRWPCRYSLPSQRQPLGASSGAGQGPATESLHSRGRVWDNTGSKTRRLRCANGLNPSDAINQLLLAGFLLNIWTPACPTPRLCLV